MLRNVNEACDGVQTLRCKYSAERVEYSVSSLPRVVTRNARDSVYDGGHAHRGVVRSVRN